MRRKPWFVWLLVYGSLGLVGAGALAAWSNRPRPNLTYKTVEMVRPGMTFRDVQDLMTVPPGDYSDLAGKDDILAKVEREVGEPLQHVWFDDDLMLVVWTDDEGKVTSHRHFRYRYRGPLSLYERARRWCGLSPSLDPNR
jgi:hypothetical protein